MARVVVVVAEMKKVWQGVGEVWQGLRHEPTAVQRWRGVKVAGLGSWIIALLVVPSAIAGSILSSMDQDLVAG